MGAHISQSFSDMLRYKCLLDDSTVLLKDGCLMGGFRLYGSDLDSATPAERETVALNLNAALRTLDERCMVHFVSLRALYGTYPGGEFSQRVTRLIDNERRSFFLERGNGFETRVYCFLTYQPPVSETKGIKRLLYGKGGGGITDEQLGEYNMRFKRLSAALSSVFTGEVLSGLSLLGALNACVNSRYSVPERFTELPYALDSMLARDLKPGTDVMIYDNKYVAVISLTTLPDFSRANMLSELNRVPFEQMWVLRFMPMDYAASYKAITNEFKKWSQRKTPLLDQILHLHSGKVDLNAETKAEDALSAQQELDAGVVNFGNVTNTIVLRDESLERLKERVLEIQNFCSRIAFGTIVEHLNSVEAFIGSLPGHGYENCRKPLVNTLNCSHLVPIGATWSGPEYEECPFYPPNSPCLLQGTARGRQPFRLSLHVGDVGHTLVLGPTGAGKSTLLATIAAQFDRYPSSQTFVFDKGRSMYPLIKAMEDAQYYFLGRDDSPALCPLACLESSSDQVWAAEFLENLVTLNGGKVDPAKRRLIQETVKTVSESTKESCERTMTSFCIDLQDPELKDALSVYTADGMYGRYLDGDKNTLAYSKVTAFELDELMNLGQKVVVPTLLYLFREIEKRLDGRPTLIILDEAWLMLDTPLFASRIKEWLKVLRKANAAVILATQSLTDVVKSAIASSILDSCPTKILLPNSQIGSVEMSRLYKENLQLNSTEMGIIATAVPKQEYFYLSPAGRRLFSLELGPAQLAFVGSSGKDDLKTIDGLIAQYGGDWVEKWLELKCPASLNEWRNLKER